MGDYCPRCHGDLLIKKGIFGHFFGCSNYPKCKFTTGARAWKKIIHNGFRDKQIVPGSYESKRR